MNVIVCHSDQERCGVREYGLQLDRSLLSLGARVRPCTYSNLRQAATELVVGDILLVHYEPNLVGGDYARLAECLGVARANGAKIVFCCHWYEHSHMQWFVDHDWVDRFVVPRDHGALRPQAVIIPLGCPMYEPTETRAQIRSRLELPVDATIITILGFLVRWKLIPEIVEATLRAMADHPRVHLHIHTPWPFNTSDASTETPRILEIIRREPAGKRAHFSVQFVPEKDALDIAHASDLGLIFHPQHTCSVSAATKQFVSARRPLVVTNANHAADILRGALRIDTFDPAAVGREAVTLATSPDRLAQLQIEAETEYERINMNAVARRYIEVFESLGAR